MLNDSGQVVSLRRMDVMGAPFVVVGAFDSNGATFLPLVAEVAFDAAIASLGQAAWTPPSIIWAEEQGEVLLPVSGAQIEVLNQMALDQLKALLATEA